LLLKYYNISSRPSAELNAVATSSSIKYFSDPFLVKQGQAVRWASYNTV
jgi:hypothetical protein